MIQANYSQFVNLKITSCADHNFKGSFGVKNLFHAMYNKKDKSQTITHNYGKFFPGFPVSGLNIVNLLQHCN